MVSNLTKRDNSRYYAFHTEVGHITEKYRVLKNEILKLIQNEYLKELMVEQRNEGSSSQGNKSQGVLEDEHSRNVIHKIHSGSRLYQSCQRLTHIQT